MPGEIHAEAVLHAGANPGFGVNGAAQVIVKIGTLGNFEEERTQAQRIRARDFEIALGEIFSAGCVSCGAGGGCCLWCGLRGGFLRRLRRRGNREQENQQWEKESAAGCCDVHEAYLSCFNLRAAPVSGLRRRRYLCRCGGFATVHDASSYDGCDGSAAERAAVEGSVARFAWRFGGAIGPGEIGGKNGEVGQRTGSDLSLNAEDA